MSGEKPTAETGAAAGEAAGEEARPVLRVLNPDATPEEIAAIVTVFAAVGGGEPPKPEPRSVWAHHHYKHRVTYRRGPGAWVASGRPH